MVPVCQGITRGHEGRSYQAERCEMTFGEWQTPSGLRVRVLVTFNTSPTSWLCVLIIDTCLFFLILLCFRFLSVVILRVLKSQVPLGWKGQTPRSHTQSLESFLEVFGDSWDVIRKKGREYLLLTV